MENNKVKKENVHKNHRQRVKERFLKHGLETFSEHQILEMALFFALPHVDTNEMAHHLINKAGSFTRVFEMSKEQMETVSGIKDNASTFLKFLEAFTKYYMNRVNFENAKKGMTYDEIGEFFVRSFINEKKEIFKACFFDENNNLIGQTVLGVGNTYSVNISFRDLVDEIIKVGAKKVALAHNHPTFSLIPSIDDATSTRSLRNMLFQMEVELIENFIICKDKYVGIIKFNEKYEVFE